LCVDHLNSHLFHLVCRLSEQPFVLRQDVIMSQKHKASSEHIDIFVLCLLLGEAQSEVQAAVPASPGTGTSFWGPLIRGRISCPGVKSPEELVRICLERSQHMSSRQECLTGSRLRMAVLFSRHEYSRTGAAMLRSFAGRGPAASVDAMPTRIRASPGSLLCGAHQHIPNHGD